MSYSNMFNGLTMKKYQPILFSMLLWTGISQADTVSVSLHFTDKNNLQGKTVGQIVLTDSDYGLIIKPELAHLMPGVHGLHVHEHADCGDMGKRAGGHFDPQKTKTHQGPYGKGHLGDLPALYVDANGQANVVTLAPRLKVKDVAGLTLMVHAGGDNYSDNPSMGGGGARLACGIIPK